MDRYKQSLSFATRPYQPGDIVGVEPTGSFSRLQGWCSRVVFTPHAKLLHFFYIGEYIEEENDYVIYESIPSHGVTIGRLSWYDYQVYRVFRLNRPDAAEIGHRIIDKVSLFGRSGYGFTDIIGLICGILHIEWNQWKAYRRLRAITAQEIAPYMAGKGLLCTELVHSVPLHLGIDILPPGCAALPCAFVQALNDGILIEVTQCGV